MAARDKRASEDEAAAPTAVASSEAPDTQSVPAEGPATPPEQPATPPEQPATPPSDGEKPPEERADDVELSKDVTGDAPAPDGAVRFAPVERYVLDRKEPIRAGGYVCAAGHGWVLDPDSAPTPDATDQEN
jgi:hypothetical protein